jgi:hypothetical protein
MALSAGRDLGPASSSNLIKALLSSLSTVFIHLEGCSRFKMQLRRWADPGFHSILRIDPRKLLQITKRLGRLLCFIMSREKARTFQHLIFRSPGEIHRRVLASRAGEIYDQHTLTASRVPAQCTHAGAPEQSVHACGYCGGPPDWPRVNRALPGTNKRTQSQSK